MRAILMGKFTGFLQYIKNSCEALNIKPTSNAKFQRFLKLASINNFVHDLTQNLFD